MRVASSGSPSSPLVMETCTLFGLLKRFNFLTKLEDTSEAVAPVSYCITARFPSICSNSASSNVGFFLPLIPETEATGLTSTSSPTSEQAEAASCLLGLSLHLSAMASMLQYSILASLSWFQGFFSFSGSSFFSSSEVIPASLTASTWSSELSSSDS